MSTDIQNTLDLFLNIISDLIHNNETEFNLERATQICADLVNQGKYDQIFKGMIEQLNENFENWHKQLTQAEGDSLLTILNDQYENFKRYCTIIPTVYTSFDNYFNKEPNKTLRAIQDAFKNTIISDLQLFEKNVTPYIINNILKIESGLKIDLNEIKNILHLYYSYQQNSDKPELYKDFIEHLIRSENEFYNEFISTNYGVIPFSDYLIKASDIYEIEKSIFEDILNETDAKEILTHFNITVLQSKEKDFLNGPNPPIMESFKSKNLIPFKYLVDMYEEYGFDMTNMYNVIADSIKNELLEKVDEFKENKHEYSLIYQMINVVIESRNIITKNEEALRLLDRAIEIVFNDDRLDITESFNQFINSYILSQFIGFNLDHPTQSIPLIYQYIHDKSKFNIIFEKLFIRRLINATENSRNEDFQIIDAIKSISPIFMPKFDKYKRTLIKSEQLKKGFYDSLNENNKIKKDPSFFNPIVFN